MLDSVTVPELGEEVVALSSGILKSVELSGSTELRSLELSLALCANAFFIKLDSALLAELFSSDENTNPVAVTIKIDVMITVESNRRLMSVQHLCTT